VNAWAQRQIVGVGQRHVQRREPRGQRARGPQVAADRLLDRRRHLAGRVIGRRQRRRQRQLLGQRVGQRAANELTGGALVGDVTVHHGHRGRHAVIGDVVDRAEHRRHRRGRPAGRRAAREVQPQLDLGVDARLEQAERLEHGAVAESHDGRVAAPRDRPRRCRRRQLGRRGGVAGRGDQASTRASDRRAARQQRRQRDRGLTGGQRVVQHAGGRRGAGDGQPRDHRVGRALFDLGGRRPHGVGHWHQVALRLAITEPQLDHQPQRVAERHLVAQRAAGAALGIAAEPALPAGVGGDGVDQRARRGAHRGPVAVGGERRRPEAGRPEPEPHERRPERQEAVR
jgi:hypothetical protein